MHYLLAITYTCAQLLVLGEAPDDEVFVLVFISSVGRVFTVPVPVSGLAGLPLSAEHWLWCSSDWVEQWH
jgi:hypothetical protein